MRLNYIFKWEIKFKRIRNAARLQQKKTKNSWKNILKQSLSSKILGIVIDLNR